MDDGDTMTSFCKFVRLSVGVAGTSVQLVVVKSEFCCNTKSVEGTSQEMTALLPERVMFNDGVGVDCQVQIPPPLTAATNLLPSAEEATDVRRPGGTFAIQVQVAPESVEVKTPLSPAATNLIPSAEQAIELQWEVGEPVACQAPIPFVKV